MAKFFDVFSQKFLEMPDLTDPHGSRAAARAARHEASSNSTPSAQNRPGLGTTYTTGSYAQRQTKGVAQQMADLLDRGDCTDSLPPG